jgi:transposase-like protein
MSTDIIKGSEFTTVDQYDPQVKAKAYEMFLTTDLTLSDIAIDLGVNSKVVASWSRKGNWRKRKEEVEIELFKSAEDQYRSLIVANRVPVMERHLEISKKIEEAIGKVIDEATSGDAIPSSMEVKRMAEALSSVSAVSARAAGIAEKPFSENGESNAGGKAQKVPLIMLNVQASANPDAEARFVDVEPEN